MTRRGLFSILLVTVLLLSACGGSDDDGGGENSDSTATTTNPDAGAEPVYGGTLKYGIEADTSSPWTPAEMVCAISCHITVRSVYDTLTIADEDGVPQPNLLESFEPNDDYTEWTFTAREGIEFHDGTPFDGEAIAFNIEALAASPLTGRALQDVTDVTSDGMTATITLDRPVPNLPVSMGTQLGYVASPTWLRAVEAGTAQPDEPVGTGPFVFESYEPGGTFRAVRNDDYWKTDAEGRELPYLDAVEFQVQDQVQTRVNALTSGQTNIMHTAAGDQVQRLRELADSGDIELEEFTQNNETGYVLLQVGDQDSPVSDINVRKALAMSLDYETYIEARSAGITEQANGPFPPGSRGYLEDTGYPDYDPEAAAQLVEEYEAENGPLELSYKTTPDEFNLTTAQLLQQMWEEVGIDVSLDQIEQGQFIVAALQGDFEMFGWRQHSGYDPLLQRVWWDSRNAIEPPGLALNFGRIDDEVIDENMNIVVESDDQAARTAAAEEVNRRFGEQAYYLWIEWVIWGIGHDPSVRNVRGGVLPDGTPTIANEGGGAHQIATIWIDEG